MKKTSLFEKYFSKLLKKKKKVKEEDDNTVGGGALGPAAGIGHQGLENTDFYAPGDARKPKALGTYTRRGKVKRRKKKKNK